LSLLTVSVQTMVCPAVEQVPPNANALKGSRSDTKTSRNVRVIGLSLCVVTDRL
jgi:hypothetical protein